MRMRREPSAVFVEILAHLPIAGIHRSRSRIIQIAESRRHPARVRVHARPDAAMRAIAIPLSADRVALLEKRAIESAMSEPTCGSDTGGAGTEDRDSLFHGDVSGQDFTALPETALRPHKRTTPALRRQTPTPKPLPDPRALPA